MKCLRCGKDIIGSVCECGFQLDDNSITTVFPLNEDALMQICIAYRENGFIIENGRLTGYCGDMQAQELHIPNGVIEIGSCDLPPYVEKVFIPESVVDLNCDTLINLGAEIVVDKGNKYFYSKDGVLFAYGVKYSVDGSGSGESTIVIDSGDTLLIYPECKSGSLYQIPNNIACIADDAFLNACVQHIILPASLKIIGNGAFGNCPRLQDLEIPDSVTWMGKDWIDKGSLRSLSMPYISHGLTPIPHVEVENFTLRISDQRTEIEASEFSKSSEYDGLPGKKTSVVLPDTVTRIGAWAFFGNTNLVSIRLSENLISIEAFAFSICELLSQISFPVKLQEIKDCAFIGCPSLKEVTLPSSIKRIEKFAFGPIEVLNIMAKDVEIDDLAFWSYLSQENRIIAPPDIKKKIIFNNLSEKLWNLLLKWIRTSVKTSTFRQ